MRNLHSSLLFRWFNEVWNQGRKDSINELAANNLIANGLGPEGKIQGIDEFKKFFDDFREQMKDIQVTVEDVISQDEMESALCKVKAKDASTGKEVEFSGISMVKIENGKIVEAWNHFDFLNMYQQLGFSLSPQQSS